MQGEDGEDGEDGEEEEEEHNCQNVTALEAWVEEVGRAGRTLAVVGLVQTEGSVRSLADGNLAPLLPLVLVPVRGAAIEAKRGVALPCDN